MSDIYDDYEKVTINLRKPIKQIRRAQDGTETTEYIETLVMREPDGEALGEIDATQGKKMAAVFPAIAIMCDVNVRVIQRLRGADLAEVMGAFTNFTKDGLEIGLT